jgi:hypothetical protein
MTTIEAGEKVYIYKLWASQMRVYEVTKVCKNSAVAMYKMKIEGGKVVEIADENQTEIRFSLSTCRTHGGKCSTEHVNLLSDGDIERAIAGQNRDIERRARDKAEREASVNEKMARAIALNPSVTYEILDGDENKGAGRATLNTTNGLAYVMFAHERREMFDSNSVYLKLSVMSKDSGQKWNVETTSGDGDTIENVLLDYVATWGLNV